MRIAILILAILLLLGAWVFFKPVASQSAPPRNPVAKRTDATGPKEQDENTSVKSPDASADSREQAESLPGTLRPDEPDTQDDGIESLIRPEQGFKRAEVAAANRTLDKLDAENLTPAQVEALRWALFEKKANETVRNNIANLLLKAKDARLAGALTAQLKDLNQTPTWRNYCIQHLEAGYRTHQQHDAILRAIHHAARTDPDESVRDVGLLQLSRLAVEFDWKYSKPEWHARVVTLVRQFLELPERTDGPGGATVQNGSGRTATEKISGIRAAGRLKLVALTSHITGLLNNTQNALGVRKAAVTELARLTSNPGITTEDRAAAKEAIKAAAASSNARLRSLAQNALKELEQNKTAEAAADKIQAK